MNTRTKIQKERDNWLAKFYPVDADNCPIEGELDHSILKWEGLRLQNRLSDASVPIDISATTCALCVRYYESQPMDMGPEERAVLACAKCPLALCRDGMPCDQTTDDEEFSPYGQWSKFLDPEPMIKALVEAKAFVEKGGK